MKNKIKQFLKKFLGIEKLEYDNQFHLVDIGILKRKVVALETAHKNTSTKVKKTCKTLTKIKKNEI